MALGVARERLITGSYILEPGGVAKQRVRANGRVLGAGGVKRSAAVPRAVLWIPSLVP